MDSKWCWEPEVGLLAPDAVIYLDVNSVPGHPTMLLALQKLSACDS